MPDPVCFGHGDLHVVDIAAVPDRLEERIAKPEGQDVLHGLLAQVMVYAVDLGFEEILAQEPVEFSRRLEIMAEGFFDHDPGMAPVAVELLARKPHRYGLEHIGRHGQVKDRTACSDSDSS